MTSRKKRFDSSSRQVFFEIQDNILTLRGQLMNPKRSDITKGVMVERIKFLRDHSKRLKREYYEHSHEEILASTFTLLNTLKTYEGKNFKKL